MGVHLWLARSTHPECPGSSSPNCNLTPVSSNITGREFLDPRLSGPMERRLLLSLAGGRDSNRKSEKTRNPQPSSSQRKKASDTPALSAGLTGGSSSSPSVPWASLCADTSAQGTLATEAAHRLQLCEVRITQCANVPAMDHGDSFLDDNELCQLLRAPQLPSTASRAAGT